jgi:hypothetical protein
LGKDLHIPDYHSVLDPVTYATVKIDWCVESLLEAIEIARENGAELIEIPDTVMTYSYTFYCKINGQKYHVTETRKEEYGDIKYKIQLI